MTDQICVHHGCDRPGTEAVAFPMAYTPSVYVGLYCVEHALALLNTQPGAQRAILGFSGGRGDRKD